MIPLGNPNKFSKTNKPCIWRPSRSQMDKAEAKFKKVAGLLRSLDCIWKVVESH